MCGKMQINEFEMWPKVNSIIVVNDEEFLSYRHI